MLTVDHLTTLRKPFRTEDHEFLNERAYITEGAITTRIEEVDPAWSFSILNLENRDKQIVATVRLTICGVSRENTGMASITTNKDGRETNEAEKSAVTDALKRAARLFGIGRYLLDLPSNVVNADSMRRYLGEGKSNLYSAAPAAPTTNEWNQATAMTFAERCKALGLDPLKVLNLKEKLGEWKGTATEAFAKLPAA